MQSSRQHILQVALKLFMEKGFKAVTFEELVEKTGFSKGAFFHYFRNKHQIFEASIDLYMQEYASVDYAHLAQISLREFLNGYFPEVRKRRSNLSSPANIFAASHYALMFEALRIMPDFKNIVAHHEDNSLAAWKTIIKSARINKEIQAVMSDEALAGLFIHCGHGIVINLILTDATLSMEEKILASWNNIYELIKV